MKPLRIINSVAPILTCDNGGWTDTWFAEYGKIFNISVYPYAEIPSDLVFFLLNNKMVAAIAPP